VLWYQLSFAPNPNWTRLFAPGPEIYRYLRDTARGLGLYEYLRADSEVVQQKWDTAAGVWRLRIDGSEPVTARFVINSVGGYVNAKNTVNIDGVDEFEGPSCDPTPGTTTTTPRASASRSSARVQWCADRGGVVGGCRES